MNGYSSLAGGTASCCCSPPMAAPGSGAAQPARRSLELTNTKETNAWEGLAIAAVTLARTFSTGSHRLCGGAGERGAGGTPGALRRAFSVRRHPAGRGVAGGYYWRIHDMDGDGDGDSVTEERHGEDEKKASKEEGEIDEDERKKKKKKRGSILRACKKLLRL